MNTIAATNLPRFAASACIAVAALCLAGWAAGISYLTSVFPGYPTMVPLTAGMTGCAAFSLRRRPGPGRRAGTALALLVAGVAAVVLLLHGADSVADLQVSSPVTAAMFLGLGASLVALHGGRYVAHAQWLAVGVLFLALLTLAGYLFQDTFLYRVLPGTGTSILTAMALALLAAGCLGVRVDEGIMAAVSGPAPEARIARRLLVSAMAMPVLLGAVVSLLLRTNAVDTETGIALLVWGVGALLVVVAWNAALRLNRLDAARRAAERTLAQALESLREADAHKDHFLAVLAHELRNPLAPIRSAADLLRLPGGIDEPRQRRTADIIARQVEHMSHLVEDLLDLSRVRQGLLTSERVPVDLRQVAADALEQTKPQFARRRHRLCTDISTAALTVMGDHRRLVQVVANLLVNAAKYTQEGGDILLRLHGDGATATISVCDNGIGIDAAQIGRVFDAFAQVKRTGERSEGGLGIGLALVRSLVEAHGGSIAVHSEGLGRGSEFAVTLPVQAMATLP